MAPNSSGGKPLGGIARMLSAFRGQLYTPPSDTISGLNPTGLPTALQPIKPVGPKGSQPLGWSYWFGINQEITPRSDAALSAAELRELATYPLARVCIENAKDILTSFPWKIQLRRVAGESLSDWKQRNAKDTKIVKITEFWMYPDGTQSWSDWWRPILEDMLVIDAASILMQRMQSGELVRMRWTDGADILRLIDDQGFTPEAPNPAYTQLWEGIPRLLMNTRQIVVRPRNIVPGNTYSSKLYGTSPTQQLAARIAIGRERLKFILAYYTDGSTPGVIQVVPGTVDANSDKVLESMQFMNSDLSGNLSRRRQWRMIQGYNTDRDDQIIQLKEPILADTYDDREIHEICFGYGISPSRLLKQLNRATAGNNQEASEKEGIIPFLTWVKNTADYIIQKQMDQPDYELVFDTDDELDATKQAEVDKTYVSTGLKSIDEIREDRGLPPWGLPETKAPIIVTATGVQPLEGSFDRVQQALDNDTTAANKPPALPAPKPAGNGGAPKK